MIDHVSYAVTDVAAVKPFYDAVLTPLDYELLTANDAFAMYRQPADGSVFAIHTGAATPLHLALRATSHAQVDEVYAAAIAAGAADNGAPGIREQYSPDYYAAFFIDPDGYKLEVVNHGEANKMAKMLDRAKQGLDKGMPVATYVKKRWGFATVADFEAYIAELQEKAGESRQI